MAVIEEGELLDLDAGAALAFVNQTRAELGLEPLAELLPGARRLAERCPLAISIGFDYHLRVTVTTSRIYFTPKHRITVLGIDPSYEVPEKVSRFIRTFDMGLLPQYEWGIERNEDR